MYNIEWAHRTHGNSTYENDCNLNAKNMMKGGTWI